MGFKNERHFKAARTALLNVPKLVSSVESHLKAAQLFRDLKRKGVTVRGAFDSSGILLTRDRDFERIAKCSDLKIWRV